jgi:hypothetical protein
VSDFNLFTGNMATGPQRGMKLAAPSWHTPSIGIDKLQLYFRRASGLKGWIDKFLANVSAAITSNEQKFFEHGRQCERNDGVRDELI